MDLPLGSRAWNSTGTDRLILSAVLINAALAVALGHAFGELITAGVGGGILAALASLVYVRWHGETVARMGLVTVMVALVALQLQVSHGAASVHPNVYVTVSLALVYCDWRPLALATALMVVHHLGFHFAQVSGGGLFVHEHPNWISVAADLGFLLTMAVWMLLAAVFLEREVKERFELEFLVKAMGSEGPIRLNLDVLRAESAAGLRLKHVQTRVASAMRQIRSVAANVQEAAQEVGASSGELLQRTDQTASGLRDAALCLEQINIIVQQSARASREAKDMSYSASQMAEQVADVVTRMVQTMKEIGTSSNRITEIIGLIDSIAFQTNILALNAAVEAARAGEQGRGFAVVASEVRNLAGRSAEAAREIRTLIGASLSTVESGSALADQAGGTMDELLRSVQRVGKVFETLTDDSSEHAQGIDVVSNSVKELDQTVRQNVAVAERSGQIADSLAAEAAQLSEVLSSFKLGQGNEAERASPLAVPKSATARAAPSDSQPKPSGHVDYF